MLHFNQEKICLIQTWEQICSNNVTWTTLYVSFWILKEKLKNVSAWHKSGFYAFLWISYIDERL